MLHHQMCGAQSMYCQNVFVETYLYYMMIYVYNNKKMKHSLRNSRKKKCVAQILVLSTSIFIGNFLSIQYIEEKPFFLIQDVFSSVACQFFYLLVYMFCLL